MASLGYTTRDRYAAFQDIAVSTINNAPHQVVLIGDSQVQVGATTGAIGAHAFKVLGTSTDLKIPAGWKVVKVQVRQVTNFTGGGGAGLTTVALGTDAQAGAFHAASAENAAPFTTTSNGWTSVSGVVSIGATTDETVQYVVAANTLTAGQMLVYLTVQPSAPAAITL